MGARRTASLVLLVGLGLLCLGSGTAQARQHRIRETRLHGGAGPLGITSGSDGNVWFAEWDANKIRRITPSGTITEFSIPTSGSGSNWIAAGPDGNLWFTEYRGNSIGVLRA
jgi:streptogramin lyase